MFICELNKIKKWPEADYLHEFLLNIIVVVFHKVGNRRQKKGTYSNKSLAELCLIIGPLVALISWILVGLVIGSSDTSIEAFKEAL